MRMMLVFQKGERLRHLGHLDLMRTMHRALRRSGLPIAYSQGFNPHVIAAFASPLSVGIWGKREVMEVSLTEEIEPQAFISKLERALPEDIKAISAKPIINNQKALMAMVSAAAYTAIIPNPEGKTLCDAINGFLSQEQINIMRKTKGGMKLSDIRPMIYDLGAEPTKLSDGQEGYAFHMALSLQETATCKPALLFEALCNYANIQCDNIDLVRTGLFTKNNKDILIPLEMV